MQSHMGNNGILDSIEIVISNANGRMKKENFKAFSSF